jgi:hypothetical protein
MENKITIKISLLLILTITLAVTSISFFSKAKAYASTFQVEAGKDVTRIISLNKGDEIFGKISVVSTINKEINFYIEDPEENIILQNEECSQQEFRFFAEKSGAYVFHFDNTASDVSKTITFEYNTRRYIFGMPQEFFLLFIIVGVLFLAIIAYGLSSSKH